MHILKNEKTRLVRRQQLVDTVIAQIRQEITSGQYEVGARFPTEAELMESMGVSRNTLREAVRALVSMGMLSVQQGRGTFIRSITGDLESFEGRLQRAEAQEIFEVRRVLEVEIARLAALKRSEEDMRELEDLLHKRTLAHKADRREECIHYDILFHNAMAKACGNSLLEDMYLAFSNALKSLLADMKSHKELDFRGILDSHQKLLEAVKSRNAAEAEQCARSYIDTTHQKYMEE